MILQRMSSRWTPVALMLAFAACGDDEGGEPGTELGPCVQQQFCNSPLLCVDGLCVHPDQLGESGGGEVGSASAGEGSASAGEGGSASTTGAEGGEGGESPTTAEGGGAEIYCSQGDAEVCICGHTADYGPLGASCSTGTVQSPARCCATEGWPAYGGCSCWTQSCRIISADTCYCGIGSPDPMEEQVESCTPGEGVCCLDSYGGTCSCHAGITSCLEGDQEVSSCTVEILGCGSDTELSTCN
jgi:hypothetical protein